MAAKNMRAKGKKNCPNVCVLPRDLTVTILAKLRCKVILRFKVVCKEWFDIITKDPIFAKTHYENNFTTLACREAIMDCYKKESKNERGWFYKLDPYRFDGVVAPDCSWDEFDVMNSCKGFLLMMICLYSKKPRMTWTYVVYNPLTNEKVFLPKISTEEYFPFCGGLGFSPVTKRFKVVLFGYDAKPVQKRILIYTLGNASNGGISGASTTGTWRMVSVPEGHLDRHIYEHAINSPVDLNGVLHVQVVKQNDTLITCFDVEKEELGEMSTPPIGKYSGMDVRSLGVYRGLLCVAVNKFGSSRVEMWVMKEYGIKESWMRLVDVKETVASEWFYKLTTLRLVDILDSGEFIFLGAQGEPRARCKSKSITYRIFYYDPINECSEYLSFPGDFPSMWIDLYTPSFFSLKDF